MNQVTRKFYVTVSLVLMFFGGMTFAFRLAKPAESGSPLFVLFVLLLLTGSGYFADAATRK